MKAREGDVLVCSVEECYIELKVTKTCLKEMCGVVDCDFDLRCCGKPMKLKTEFYSER
jgi:hypothetical protein